MPFASGNGKTDSQRAITMQVMRQPGSNTIAVTDAVRALIRKGDDHQLLSQISTRRAEGMMTMEQSLAELVRAARISRETAYAHCYHPDDLRRHLGV